jgi:hypothetical protein
MDDASRSVRGGDSTDREWASSGAADPGEPLSAEETRRAAEIRSEIAQTREQMSETIEAIQERLTPSNLVAQASDSVKEAASRKVQQMTNTAGEAAEQVLDSSFVQTLRSNPIPAAMIGIGTAWLLLRRRSDSDRYGYSGSSYRIRQGGDWRTPGARIGGTGYGSSYGTSGASGRGYGTPSGDSGYGAVGTSGGSGSGYGSRYGTEGTGSNFAAGTSGIGTSSVGTSGSGEYTGVSGGYAGGASGPAGYPSGSAGEWSGREDGVQRSYSGYGSNRASGMSFERVIRDNPLALGAAAVLVGAAIGMSIPSTDAENEFMGETRDNVVDRAREMAGEAASKVSEVAGEVKNKVNEVAAEVKNAASTAVQGMTEKTGSSGNTGSIGGSGSKSGGSSASGSGSFGGSTSSGSGSIGGSGSISGSADIGGSDNGGNTSGSDSTTGRKKSGSTRS